MATKKDIVRMKIISEARQSKGGWISGDVRRVAHSFKGCKKLTEDGHQDETDLKVILRRHGIKSPAELSLSRALESMRFGDGIVADFQTAQNIIASANQTFAALPSRIRNEFNNDPATFLAAASNPDNREAFEKLGLSTAHFPAKPAEAGAGKAANAAAAPDSGADKGAA